MASAESNFSRLRQLRKWWLACWHIIHVRM